MSSRVCMHKHDIVCDAVCVCMGTYKILCVCVCVVMVMSVVRMIPF